MFEFILDFVIGPLLDLASCRFDWREWKRKLLRDYLPWGLMTLAFVLCAWGMGSGFWFLTVSGFLGVLYFGWLNFRIARADRRAGNAKEEAVFSFPEDIPLPKGNIMEQLPEDEQLRGKLEDSHRCLNSRM